MVDLFLAISQVMSLCWLYGLYDAIIYIYNNGMLDYITPAEELLAQLCSAVTAEKPLSQNQIDLGNKILVYVSCCLAGRAYPHGDIPSDRIAQARFTKKKLVKTDSSNFYFSFAGEV